MSNETEQPRSKMNPYTAPAWRRNGTGTSWTTEYRGYDLYVHYNNHKTIEHTIKDASNQAVVSTLSHHRKDWTMNKVKQHCIDTVDQIIKAIY